MHFLFSKQTVDIPVATGFLKRWHNGDQIIQHREELKNAIAKMIELKEYLKHE